MQASPTSSRSGERSSASSGPTRATWTYKGDTLISGASTNGGGGSPPTAITPDIYQIPFDTLNVTIQQRIIDGLTLSFAAKNLTNPDIQTVYRIDGTDTLQSTYSAGIDFSLGLTYRIDF
ncbi:MAG: hypothetical protein RLZZ217_982 [Planctomycetota bacterium]